jgi:rhodanese-related sulfurtransferase
LSCAILPVDLNHQRQSPDTALVDTRTATEFAQFHIDGAMHINMAELRSKAFLREKLIVLIGNGKAEQELYIDCKRLKSNGYKQVKMLRGGMSAWLASGYNVLGQSPKPAKLTKLTASELWIESQFTSNLILVVAGQESLQKQIKGSLLIGDEKPKTIQSAIKQRIKKPQSIALASAVLVVSKNAVVQAISQAIKPIPLLVYSESSDAFVSQLTQQTAVWAAHARGPKQPSGCGR